MNNHSKPRGHYGLQHTILGWLTCIVQSLNSATPSLCSIRVWTKSTIFRSLLWLAWPLINKAYDYPGISGYLWIDINTDKDNRLYQGRVYQSHFNTAINLPCSCCRRHNQPPDHKLTFNMFDKLGTRADNCQWCTGSMVVPTSWVPQLCILPRPWHCMGTLLLLV